MATKTEVVEILNQFFDIPLLGEAVEAWMIEKVLSSFYDYVPPFIWDVALSVSDGLTKAEIDSVMELIITLIANHLKTPWCPTAVRDSVVRRVLDSLRKALQVDERLKALPA